MAEITNFPPRKKNKGFLSTMTASARTAEAAVVPDEPGQDQRGAATPASTKRNTKKSATHNTTVNLTVDQRAWLRWREVIAKKSMGDLIRDAIDQQMVDNPMPNEVAAIFRPE